jgi:hypothetical protein
LGTSSARVASAPTVFRNAASASSPINTTGRRGASGAVAAWLTNCLASRMAAGSAV